MWSNRWLRSGAAAATLVVVAMPPAQAHGAPAPISVQLARHQFDALTAPAAVIAFVEASGVGWDMPEEGPRYGPGSFAVSADGQAWLLDAVNRRLLGWSAGRRNQPDQTVPAPAGAADFARAANGTFYFTTFAPGGRPQLVAASADGTERWRLPLHEDLFNAQLHWGPNGVLYQVTPQAWIPVVGSDGIALTAAQQSRNTLKYQPLSDTQRLSMTDASPTSVRVALLDNTGAMVRSWLITSVTEIAPNWAAVPSLARGDPIVTLDVYDWSRPEASNQLEQITLRLTASGGTEVLHLDNAYWGDTPVKEYLSAGESFYQLQTSRGSGVRIVRFAVARASTPSVATTLPPIPATPPTAAPSPSVTPTGTAQAYPAPASTPAGVWLVLAGLAGLVLAGTGLLFWRRSR